MSDRDDAINLTVTPVPGDEEMAAISAAVLSLMTGRDGSMDEEPPAGGGRERWARAGRREVLRPVGGDESD